MDQLYLPLKDIHSYLRWIILVLIIIVVVKYVAGWLSKNKFTSIDNRLSLFLTISLDIQLLLGLILYFFLSPFTQHAMDFGGYAIEDPQTRFYAMEHPVIMVLAIVFAHLGRALSKKGKTDQAKFKRGALWFSLSLIFILAGLPR